MVRVQNQQAIPGNIRSLLRLGFGVEDIAVKLGIPVEGVRFQVRKMRETGELASMFRGRDQ